MEELEYNPELDTNPPPDDILLGNGEDVPGEAEAVAPVALVIAANEGDFDSVVNFVENLHFPIESEDRVRRRLQARDVGTLHTRRLGLHTITPAM